MPQFVSPLAPTMFIRRNAGKTIPLVIVITLAVMLVQSIIGLINSIPLSIRTIYGYSSRFLAVSPRLDPTLTPKLLDLLKDKPPVEVDRYIICRGSSAQVKSIVGKWPFAIMAMETEDIKYYLARQGSQGIEGRFPSPGKPEMIVSRPVAKNLNLTLGKVFLRPEDAENFSRKEVKIVGIADTDQWLMVGDKEYYADTQPIQIDFILAFTKNLDDQGEFDRWAETKLKGEFAQVFAYHQIKKQSEEMFGILYRIINVVIFVLVVVITFMMGMLMNIYQSQRLVEFGLLQAIGFTKSQLLKRVLAESLIVIVGGWIVGLFVARLVLVGVKTTLMDPQSFALNIADPMAIAYTTPIPFAIMIVAVGTIWLRFRNFDPVAVVERRIV
jgi:ABC-type lipoprotein release transport system permease subunit